jgi:hypothetical protein
MCMTGSFVLLFSFSVRVFLGLSFCVSFWACVSLPRSLFLSLFRGLALSLSLRVFFSACLSLCVSFFACVSLPRSLSLSLPISPEVSFSSCFQRPSSIYPPTILPTDLFFQSKTSRPERPLVNFHPPHPNPKMRCTPTTTALALALALVASVSAASIVKVNNYCRESHWITIMNGTYFVQGNGTWELPSAWAYETPIQGVGSQYTFSILICTCTFTHHIHLSALPALPALPTFHLPALTSSTHFHNFFAFSLSLSLSLCGC